VTTPYVFWWVGDVHGQAGVDDASGAIIGACVVLCDPFLTYWQGHGGLAQQGLIMSDALNETHIVDGPAYLTTSLLRST
jgi:hypothetical protein